MRIITGIARGRRLLCPEGLGTRPILDAQKQALFNVLGDRAVVDGVVDVFAGSGGLGLEALSRGSEHATFIERGKPALDCLRQNIENCNFSECSQVIASDVYKVDWSRLTRPISLAFIDAPFPMFVDDRPRLEKLLMTVVEVPIVAVGATIVWRMPDDAVEVPIPPALVIDDVREYGRSRIFLLTKTVA